MLLIQKSVLWEQQHQLSFVTIVQYVIHNCLSFAANKQGTEFCLNLSQVTTEKLVNLHQFQFQEMCY